MILFHLLGSLCAGQYSDTLRTLPSGSGQSTYSTMIVVNFLRICQTDQMLSDPLMQ